MNRRQFFGSFLSVPIAASLVIPELTRTIFLPPRDGWYEDQNILLPYVNIREELIEAIYNVDPFKTPFFNMASKWKIVKAGDSWDVYATPWLR